LAFVETCGPVFVVVVSVSEFVVGSWCVQLQICVITSQTQKHIILWLWVILFGETSIMAIMQGRSQPWEPPVSAPLINSAKQWFLCNFSPSCRCQLTALVTHSSVTAIMCCDFVVQQSAFL
jgi:hypothetical protein